MGKFEIIGHRKVMGKDTGEIIEIDDDQLAATLVAGNHIKEVKRARTKKEQWPSFI